MYVCVSSKLALKQSVVYIISARNGEKPLTSDKIKKNIKALKGKLRKNTSRLYQHLFSGVNEVSIFDLTWKDPLANQVISDDSDLIQKLPEQLRESFMVKFFLGKKCVNFFHGVT